GLPLSARIPPARHYSRSNLVHNRASPGRYRATDTGTVLSLSLTADKRQSRVSDLVVYRAWRLSELTGELGNNVPDSPNRFFEEVRNLVPEERGNPAEETTTALPFLKRSIRDRQVPPGTETRVSASRRTTGGYLPVAESVPAVWPLAPPEPAPPFTPMLNPCARPPIQC